MKVLARIAAPALLVAGTLLASPQSASATDPFTMSAACTPGVGCSSMRFYVDANEAVAINSLALTFVSGWSFDKAPVSSFSAEDSWGEFGGPAYISNASKTATMNFLADVLFPFELFAAGDQGFLDLEVFGQGDIAFTCVAELGDGRTVNCEFPREPGPGVPEPLSVVLLGTGLAGVALARRRRSERLVA